MVSSVWQDIRYASRALLKKPALTLVIVATLALGIGAVSSIFSVANALVLKPFPFKNLDRLVAVHERLPNAGLKATAVSPADFKDWRDQNTVFGEVVAYRVRDITVTGVAEPERVRASYVSSGFFSALEIRPTLGRVLLAEEDQPGRDQVAVLGYGLWQRRFAADPNIVGQNVTIDGRTVTAIGVMPPALDFPFGTELWMPLGLTPEQFTQRDTRNLQVLAQLKPGIALGAAQAEMLSIAKRIEEQYPLTNAGLGVEVIPLSELQGAFTGPLLVVLLGMAAFLLLIACTNVTNLLLAQATVRQREIALRAALGATRWRVLRQQLIESILISALSGVVGLVASVWTSNVIRGSLPPDIARYLPGWNEIGVDLYVLLFTVGASTLTTVVFGLLPGLRASRTDLNQVLQRDARLSGGTSGRRTRNALVASEVALALALLVGAGLMVKGFWRVLNTLDLANPESVLTFHTDLPEAKYKEPEKVSEFYQQVIQRLSTLPGVESVSVASNTPLNNSPNRTIELTLEGRETLQSGERRPADLLTISRGYFNTVGARLMSGRDFSDSDGRGTTPVTIISASSARRYFANEKPLGRRLKLTGDPAGQWLTVVGVVSDTRQAWFDRDIRPQVYIPYRQAPRARMSFLLRTSIDPMILIGPARAQVFAVDKDQPVNEPKTLARLIVDEMSPFRFAAVLVSVFGMIALLLAAVGVYSVMSYSVARRRQEIGLRLALGAQGPEVLRLVVKQGMKTCLVGLLIGALVAYLLSRIMVSSLFGVVELEYSILAAFVGLLILVALLSCYLPARRAARVDPLVALRNE